MDEQQQAVQRPEHVPPPIAPRDLGGSGAGSGAQGPLDDPRVLQVLTTEHWSLLSARSLVYNEAFARAGMFLTFVSASLVALALGANAMAFSSDFLVLAGALLGLDLVIGLATVGRILDVSVDDLRSIHAMNRIRNAYAQMAPGALPYFVSSIHDDVAGVMATYGEPAGSSSALAAFLHSLTTMGGMITAINAVLAGAVGGLVVVIVHGGSAVAASTALVLFVVVFAAQSRYSVRRIRAFEAGLEARFPTPR